jgi:hypothetical protein
MSHADIHLTVSSDSEVTLVGTNTLGPQGPPGPEGQWLAMTQAEYDALSTKDPETLYVIIP